MADTDVDFSGARLVLLDIADQLVERLGFPPACFDHRVEGVDVLLGATHIDGIGESRTRCAGKGQGQERAKHHARESNAECRHDRPLEASLESTTGGEAGPSSRPRRVSVRVAPAVWNPVWRRSNAGNLAPSVLRWSAVAIAVAAQKVLFADRVVGA